LVLVMLGALIVVWVLWHGIRQRVRPGALPVPALIEADRLEARPGDLSDFNVLILSVDTTRSDHVGCYGNRAIETPVIDGLAREGILFANTTTPSPSTVPAHASILTGLYPRRHGARANGTFRLDDEITTLGERLQARGYRTCAVVSSFVLDSRFGLAQGFDEYHDDLSRGIQHSPHMFRERPAEFTNEVAARWLREHGRDRFFLWVHYFDPHAVYLPPEPFRSRYSDNLYDGEIAYVDSMIGELLGILDEVGCRERTLVVCTSDHGEGLGEHGEQTHSLFIYDSTLQVPLIVSAPSVLPCGFIVSSQTSLADITPTVLALLGEEVPADLDGVSLLEAHAPSRSVLVETIATMTLHGWAPLVGTRSLDYKYILAPRPELYDLRADPEELADLCRKKSTIASELRDSLLVAMAGDPLLSDRLVTPNLVMDEETRRLLESLGYVATVSEPGAAPRSRLDPKDMVPRYERLQEGINLRAAGHVGEALEIITDYVAEVDGDVFARQILASIYNGRGEPEKALEVIQRAEEYEPKSEHIKLIQAYAHLGRGDTDGAEAAAREALRIEPEFAQAMVALGQVALRRGDEEEALGFFERAVETNPGTTAALAYVSTGGLLFRTGHLELAETAYLNAIRYDALNGAARDGLANIMIERGDLDRAAEQLGLALRFNPVQPRALASLAALRLMQGDEKGALALCERALDISPRFGPALNNLGMVYRRQGRPDLAEECYKKAIEHAPYLDEPHINLAQLYSHQGRPEDEMREFRLALRANPHSKIALANIGAHEYNEGRVDNALQCYLQALQVDPDYVLVHKNIASIYAQKGDHARAAEHLRRTLELDPRQPQSEQLRYMLSIYERTETEAD
jgi:arylsulfatase A-like enzyme/tetratricopeptide (TPR) repeat protein